MAQLKDTINKSHEIQWNKVWKRNLIFPCFLVIERKLTILYDRTKNRREVSGTIKERLSVEKKNILSDKVSLF